MGYIQEFMKQAIEEARLASKEGEVPVGALVVKEGKVIASAHNGCEREKNPLRHAELIAIEKAIECTQDKYLTDCDLYVTLEPCPMCMGAVMNSRIKNVYIGAEDKSFGASGTRYNLTRAMNHKADVYFGICEDECKEILNDFFKGLREDK